MKTSKNESTSLTLDGKFKLNLPTEIDIKPDFEFNVSKNWIMRVFKTEETKTGYVDQYGSVYPERTIITYDVTVTHKDGKPLNSDSYHNRGNECSSLLDVKNYAEVVAYRLRPKTKTTKVDIDDDEG